MRDKKEYLRQYYLANKQKVIDRAKQWKKDNHQKVLEGAKRYRENNKAKCIDASNKWRKDNRERVNANDRARFAKDPKKAHVRVRLWREKHSDQQSAILKKWREANPQRYVVYANNRRARVLEAGGEFTLEDVKRLEILQKGLCAICKEPLGRKYHVDHIQPLSKGGNNSRFNIQLTCKTCNLSKHNTDPIKFMQARGMLL